MRIFRPRPLHYIGWLSLIAVPAAIALQKGDRLIAAYLIASLIYFALIYLRYEVIAEKTSLSIRLLGRRRTVRYSAITNVEWKSGFLRRFPPDMCRMELRSGEVVCLTLRPLSKSDAGELHALIRQGLGLPPQTGGPP